MTGPSDVGAGAGFSATGGAAVATEGGAVGAVVGPGAVGLGVEVGCGVTSGGTSRSETRQRLGLTALLTVKLVAARVGLGISGRCDRPSAYALTTAMAITATAISAVRDSAFLMYSEHSQSAAHREVRRGGGAAFDFNGPLQ
jgi:hypothetical protein